MTTRSILWGHSKRLRKLAARRISGGDGPPRWGRALGLLFFAVSLLVIACSGDSETPFTSPGGPGGEVASARQGLKKGTAGAVNGDDDYCNDAANKCAKGEGDCDSGTQCLSGLVCSRVGTRFGFSPTTDVCVPSHCVNGTFDPSSGELDVDCGGDCGTCLPNCSGTPGGEPFCEGCRCQAGQGDCDGNEQCQRGLTCQSNVGLKFNLPRLNDACVAPHCTNGVLDATAGETLVDCGGECGACPITEFDAGSLHACQVSLGRVLCWGSNASGQLGFDPAVQVKVSIPTPVPGVPVGQTLVTAGGSHSCAVSSLGVVQCWGANDVGQLGNGTTSATPSYTPVTVSGAPSSIAQIVSGEKHVCVRTTAGAVSCWGANEVGQLGNPVSASQSSPLPVTGLPPVVHLSAALNHTCAALTDGTVRCWGANDSGKLGNGGTAASATPVIVAGVTGATQVSTGNTHSCALKSGGTVYCWGSNVGNRLAIDTAAGHLSGATPALVQGVTVAISLASAADSTCIAKSSAGGPVFCWGAGAKGQIGAGTTFPIIAAPTQVLVTNRTTVLRGGGEFMCANTTDSPSVLRCWGDDNLGQLGKGTVNFQGSPEVVWPPPKAASIVDPGDVSTCAVADGKVYCWGQNDSGQIGDGTYIQRRVPTQVTGITNAINVAVGNEHACAVLGDGTLRCWGNNPFGQLGNGGTASSNVPVTNGVTSAARVDAGGSSTCVLLTNGAISCWGRGTVGELGNGATASSSSPVTVNLPSAASALSVGLRHACAIVNGSAYCWGSNVEGELGDGTKTNRPAPVPVTGLPVTGLSNVVAIAAGHRHSCAIVSGGQAYCWGLNSDGQLGGNTSSLTPVAVQGITKAKSISAWGSFTCAILETGQMKCWGQNARGQVGVGSTEPKVTIPEVVPGVWRSVSAGGRHGCGLLMSGQIRCWGYNDFGQTGNGKAWIYPEGATAFPAAVPSARDSQCSSDADCSHGQVCWLQQGPRFDLPQGSNVCVNAECLSTPTPGCGSPTAKCGRCDNTPRSCDGTAGSCNFGESCGVDNGTSLGLPSNQRGCWSSGCDDAPFRLANCGTVNSLCGTCPLGVVPCTTGANCCADGIRNGGETDVDCGGSCEPCDGGMGCILTADCASGLVCGFRNGGCFGSARGSSVCWPGTCEDGIDPTLGDCGQAESPCGSSCTCATSCDASDPASSCPEGETCRPGMGGPLGLPTPDACADPRCPSNEASLCGSTTSICGSCLCTASSGCEPLPPQNVGFTYDVLGRLIGVAQNGTTTEGYAYDRAGNRCTASNGPVAQVNGYCAGTQVNEHYSSTWSEDTVSDIATYSDGDGNFTLTWTPLPRTVSLQLFHIPPGQAGVLTELSPDAVSESYSGAASGLHQFNLNACITDFDNEENEFLNCNNFLRFDITVN